MQTKIDISESTKRRLKTFLKDMITTQEVWIGGVINYHSMSSNIIKFTTQSMFSHVNFWNPKRKRGIGAEDLKRVLLVDYNNYKDNDPIYYVTKRLDLEYLEKIFKFDYIEKVFYALGKISKDDVEKHIFRKRYSQFLSLRYKYSLEECFEYLWNKKFSYEGIEPKFKNLDKLPMKFLKEFIIIGIIKHIYMNFGKKYDLGSTLSICFTPWFNSDLQEKEYFCSEFVSENLLFAGIYPFDIKTKDPKSVAPGDVLDLSHIYYNSQTQIYYVSHDGVQKLDFNNNNLTVLKNYIFSVEDLKGTIDKQKAGADFMKDNIFRFAELSQKNNFKYLKLAGAGYIMALIGFAAYNSGMVDMFSGDISGSKIIFSGLGLFINIFKYFSYSFVLLLLMIIMIGYIQYRRNLQY